MLKVSNLGINFGGLQAVTDFNLEIFENELVGLIGPNGAGKTTVFNLLTGVYSPTSGGIELDKVSFYGKKPHEISKLGVARTFQNIRLFKNLTVLDNVKIGIHNIEYYSTFDAVFKTNKYKNVEARMNHKAIELLKIFDLSQYANIKACNLPYGKQRELEIVRALASNPKLLLLDEPAAGMNPQETENLMLLIKKIKNEFKISILLIEHDMNLVMNICEKITVLNYGKVLATGTPKKIQSNKDVIKAYLGG